MRACIVVTAVLLSRAAWASGPQLETTPAVLDFGRAAYDTPSPTLRITAKNLGEAVGHREIVLDVPYVIANHGGSLGAGETEFWDIACQPTEPGPATGFFRIDVCGATCEDEWIDTITLSCQPGLLDTNDGQIGIAAYAFATETQAIAYQNPGPAPITITGFQAHRDEFKLALARGTLPVTLAAGERLDLIASFTSASEDVIGDVDVLAGATIAGRTRISGITRPQLAIGGAVPLPLGATYALPITVRNSFPIARTIMAVTSDFGTVAPGLVGTRLAPGELARGSITVTGSAIGGVQGSIAVMFDLGQGDVRTLRMDTVAASFAVTAEDATPADAAIDFGVRRVGAGAVERSLTIANLTDTDRAVTECFPLIAPYAIVDCPAMIPANGSAQLTVRFMPTTPGPVVYSALLSVQGLGLVGGYVTSDVIAQQLELSGDPLLFPETMVNGHSTAALAITNLADNPITLPIHVSGAFTAEAASITIAPRAHAMLALTFSPTTAGDSDGQLVLGANGDPDQRVLALLGTARAATGDGGPDGPPTGNDGGDTPPPSDGGCSAGGPTSLLALLTLVPRWRRRRLPRTVPAR